MKTYQWQLLVAACLALTAFSAAKAQDDESSDGARTIDEIIVTAQRREENLQDVPVSLTAVSGDALLQRSINELTQLPLAAPTLQVGQDNTFAIRGIGSQIFAETIDPSVALMIDGVNYGRNAMAFIPFIDVDSVQVLNGPQGLLFGKNASAGLVNVATRQPDPEAFDGDFSAEYLVRNSTPDDASGMIYRGTLNVPAGENSAFRFNAFFSDQDSIIDNVFPNPSDVRVDLDQDRIGFKAKYLYEDGPWSVYLIADYNENTGTGGRFGRTFRLVGAGSDLEPIMDADGIVPGPENLTNNSDGQMFRDEETGGLVSTIGYEFDNGISLVNITGWRTFEGKQNLHNDFHAGQDIVDNPNTNDLTQFSNELRFVLPQTEAYSGQFGVYYFDLSSEIFDALDVAGPPPFIAVGFPFCVGADPMPGPPPACNVSNDVFLGSDGATELDIESIAAFGQFDFFLTDRFTATVGARVTRDDVSTSVLQTQRNYFVNIGGPSGLFQDSIDNTNFSWKLAGKYDVSDRAMIYASVGQGYKAPGFNTENLDDPNIPFAVQDEVSTTVELGYRSEWMDDRLVFNISAFFTEFDNYQAQSFNIDAQAFIIQNAATVTSQGAEVSLRALLSDAFSVNWELAFLDSTFDEFAAASCTPDAATCGPGDAFFDASGFSTPLAPDVTSSLQAVYEAPITDSLDGFFQGSVYYRSQVAYGVGSPLLEVGSLTTLNLSAGITTENGLRVSAFCKNCTDDKVPTSIAFDPGENAAGFASTQQTWGLDSVRAIGIELSKQF